MSFALNLGFKCKSAPTPPSYHINPLLPDKPINSHLVNLCSLTRTSTLPRFHLIVNIIFRPPLSIRYLLLGGRVSKMGSFMVWALPLCGFTRAFRTPLGLNHLPPQDPSEMVFPATTNHPPILRPTTTTHAIAAPRPPNNSHHRYSTSTYSANQILRWHCIMMTSNSNRVLRHL